MAAGFGAREGALVLISGATKGILEGLKIREQRRATREKEDLEREKLGILQQKGLEQRQLESELSESRKDLIDVKAASIESKGVLADFKQLTSGLDSVDKLRDERRGLQKTLEIVGADSTIGKAIQNQINDIDEQMAGRKRVNSFLEGELNQKTGGKFSKLLKAPGSAREIGRGTFDISKQPQNVQNAFTELRSLSVDDLNQEGTLERIREKFGIAPGSQAETALLDESERLVLSERNRILPENLGAGGFIPGAPTPFVAPEFRTGPGGIKVEE